MIVFWKNESESWRAERGGEICSAAQRKQSRVQDDQTMQHTLARNVQIITSTPLPVSIDFRSLAGLRSELDFARYGMLPEASELERLGHDCSCSFDPMILCAKHPCLCKLCGSSGLPSMNCTWRRRAITFIESEFSANVMDSVALEKLNYCQVLELNGMQCCTSARERNLLNVIAALPIVQPLWGTHACIDTSQGIERLPFRFNGTIPCPARNSRMFSFRDGKQLTTMQIAKLMGMEVSEMTEALSGISDTGFREMLGNGLHVASAGVGLTALLASLR